MNEVIISGVIVNDINVSYTQSGKCLAKFVIANNRGYGDKKKTSFINCQSWEKTAECMGNTLSKGRKILVKGEWSQQNWETDGQKHRKEYIEVRDFEYMDSKKNGQADNSGTGANSFGSEVFPDEEIPF